MTQIIFTAADLPTLTAAAEAMGFYTPGSGATPGHINTVGVIPNGGSWFYNFVGQVVATPAVYDNTTFPPTLTTAAVMAPGLWGRLIFNADPTYIPPIPTSSGVTLYTLQPIGLADPVTGALALEWTADGVTIAPAYVGSIGQVM